MTDAQAIDPVLVEDFRQYALLVADTETSPPFMEAVPLRDMVDGLSMHMCAVGLVAATRLAEEIGGSPALRDSYLAIAHSHAETGLTVLLRNSRLAAFLRHNLAYLPNIQLAA